jgi:hypothetical protein
MNVIPWLQDREWREGVVRRPLRAAISTELRVKAFWIAAPLVVVCYLLFNSGVALFALFVATMLIVSAVTVLPLMEGARSVSCEFRFEQVPFILGGKLRGTLFASFPRAPSDYTRVVLRCVDGERTFWSKSHSFVPENPAPASGVAKIPIAFDLPDKAPITSRTTHWQLTITARFPLVQYEGMFSVPVFAKNAASLVENTANAQHEVPDDLRKALSVFDDEPRAT